MTCKGLFFKIDPITKNINTIPSISCSGCPACRQTLMAVAKAFKAGRLEDFIFEPNVVYTPLVDLKTDVLRFTPTTIYKEN